MTSKDRKHLIDVWGFSDKPQNYLEDKFEEYASKHNQTLNHVVQANLIVCGIATNKQQDFDEINEMIGILANIGIRGAEGGQCLKRIIQRVDIFITGRNYASIKTVLKQESCRANFQELFDKSCYAGANALITELNNREMILRD